MNDELEACPKCQGTDLRRGRPTWSDNGIMAEIQCENCGEPFWAEYRFECIIQEEEKV
jgi:hypothetical protein